MHTFAQDIRYSLRGLIRNPGFAAVAVLTLALGIGTVTTIFSILDAAVLRPLPYRDPDALMTVSITRREGNTASVFPWSYPKFESFRRHVKSFERVAAHANLDLNLTGVAEPERLAAEIVSADYFPVLGVAPAIGRTFSAEEDRPGSGAVALLSWGLWQRRYGGDRSILGKPIEINRQPMTIVGVLPERFGGLSGDAEIWVPTAMANAFMYPDILQESGNHWHDVVARRKAGIVAAAAQAEMDAVGARIAEENPMEVSGAVWGASAAPLNGSRVDPALRRSVLVLFGAVTCVLLIACANVAALLLARASRRGREVAIRAAIGAGRGRIVRQVLTESLVLSLFGGVAGVLLSLWGVESLSRLERLSGVGDPTFLFRFAEIQVDGRVLAFALAVSLATGLLFGLAPALHASRTDLAEALKEGSIVAGAAGRRGLTPRGLLVPVQVALALVLVVGAGLLARSLVRLSGYSAGFRSEGVLTLRFDPSGVTEDDRSKAIAFRRALLERLAALPGVEAAATGRTAPLASRNMVAIVRQVDEKRFVSSGRSTGESGAVQIGLHDVAPDYFKVLSIPIQKGRAFTATDREGAPKVCIVSESAARQLWPGEDPIGHRIAATSFFFDKDATAEVVGVAGDVLYGKPMDRPILDLYYPTLQGGLPWATLFVKAARGGQPASLTPAVRREIKTLAPNLPVFDVASMHERSARTFSRERFGATLLGLLAGIALFLAAVGIYGLVAEIVASRTREIGVRMALGARPADILRDVVRSGLTLSGIGLAAGLAAAIGLSRLLSSLLFGVGTMDPATYGAGAAVLLIVAVVASWIPARRATRIDPTAALRAE